IVVDPEKLYQSIQTKPCVPNTSEGIRHSEETCPELIAHGTELLRRYRFNLSFQNAQQIATSRAAMPRCRPGRRLDEIQDFALAIGGKFEHATDDLILKGHAAIIPAAAARGPWAAAIHRPGPLARRR